MTETTEYPKLLADIGGTNARFALLLADRSISRQHVLPTSDYPDFVQAVRAYLEWAGQPRIVDAAVAIANPVSGDRLDMTNHDWSFSIEESRRQLGLQRLIFKNDFTALAMSIPSLSLADYYQVGGAKAVEGEQIAVLGPGTGLGVSGLVPADGRWIPLESEGGHVSLSPGNPRECAILEECWQRFGHVSAERLVSGMGLQNLYQVISKLDGKKPAELSPAQITDKALQGSDSCCEEALQTFCGLLGSVAGNLALTLAALGGVYIGGGIVPRLGDYFAASTFRHRFEQKGRFSAYLQAIPVFVIQRDNPALLGISNAF
ncbi:MAG: glucokinase [Gammaproteobacteria bacterium]|nr:glucokinase [Gammaproteobacteria bacterium]